MEYVLCAVRAYHAVLNFFEGFFPVGISYRSDWRLCSMEKDESYHGNTREELCSTEDFPLLIHSVYRTKGAFEEKRCALHWLQVHRDPYFVEHLFERTQIPWLFIGYREGDDRIDCTDALSEFICGGNIIHKDLFDAVIPESRGKEWIYIHPKTFEETEFPSDGMLIEYDESPEDDESGDKKND